MDSRAINRRSLLVFTKPALPGRVKTRLIGDLTATQTARLHAAFVDDLVERLARGSFSLRLAWALEEEEGVPKYRLGDGTEVQGFRQRGETLGNRLFNGLHTAAETFPTVAAMGSDHPTVPVGAVEEAFERIEKGVDVVLGPASDGGYYLIACSRQALDRDLFEAIPWSTAGVLDATVAAIRRLGLTWEALPEGSDVDTPEDLDRLVEFLKAHGPSISGQEATLDCPRTRQVLTSWGRLSQEGPS